MWRPDRAIDLSHSNISDKTQTLTRPIVVVSAIRARCSDANALPAGDERLLDLIAVQLRRLRLEKSVATA